MISNQHIILKQIMDEFMKDPKEITALRKRVRFYEFESWEIIPNVIFNENCKDPKPQYYDYDEDGMPHLTDK